MIRVVVTDIEGTTSSIEFVHKVLFPYADEHMAEFVRSSHEDSPEVREQLDQVARASGVAREDLDGLISVLKEWIQQDRKETSLKALQGMLWQQGYQHGHFKGHVYEDAAAYLHRWHDRGLRLYVYSSGSVQAQKLIFGFSDAGDLTPCFSGYFDTRVGAKRDPEAYQNILNELGVEPKTVLFLSDVEAELEAAEAVGMKTAWLVRGAQAPSSERPQYRDFSEVDELLRR
ncbi:acireductone synthase [Marinobacter sp. X15-166B]|uniref:acireductone synthase n=1 Tax=Marinobacter sp. X15-166B TaxID=1897620 RepID=UPI00085CCF5F|nr:acireductone synthase [Marinobacter sp. X15-166B]OEY67828.1 2,3-diketo-5-methylthio-1-phosphopentane phosphatase [Marinobacter sp. X15-166B]